MSKKLLFTLPLIFFLFPPSYSLGFEAKGQDCSKCHTLSSTEADDLLKNVIPNAKVLDVRISPVKGLWEVFAESAGRKGMVYIDFSKKFLMMGSVISIREKKNLSQERLTELNKVDVSQIPLNDALVMGDPKAKIRIVVFDDPD